LHYSLSSPFMRRSMLGVAVLSITIILSLLILTRFPSYQFRIVVQNVYTVNSTIPVANGKIKHDERHLSDVNQLKGADKVSLLEDIVYQFQTGLVIENLILDGQRLRLSYCTNAVIRNVTVNASYWGIMIGDSTRVTVENCTVTDGIASTDTVDITIKECTITKSEYYSGNIGVENCEEIIIANNTLYNTVISITESSDACIGNNSFLNSTSNKVHAYSCENLEISNNSMVPATGGIEVFCSDQVMITDNTVDQSAINAADSTRVNISNNTLTNTESMDIRAVSNSYLNITGNSIENSITGITVTSNNVTSITGNKINEIQSYALVFMGCQELLYQDNLINNTKQALYCINDSSITSRNIEITGNHYWNIEKNFSLLTGEITFGPRGLNVYGNYLDGVIFDGIPGITGTATTTATTTTETTSTSVSSKTVVITVMPVLVTLAVTAVTDRRRKHD